MNPNRALATLALALGALAASLAWGGYALQRTVLDPDFTAEAARGVLSSEPVARQLSDDLAVQLADQVAGLGPQAQPLADAADAALDDERVAAAFADALAAVHARLLGQEVAPAVLDVGAVTGAARQALAAQDPALAAQLPDDVAFELALAEDRTLPDLGGLADAVGTLVLLLAFVAAAGFAAGVALHPDQPAALRRVGRRLAYLAAAPIVVALVVPWLLRATGSDVALGTAPFVRALGGRLLGPAVLLGLVGGGLLAAGVLLGREPRTRRPAPAGATAPG